MNDIRTDFPILAQKSHGKPFIYFDNAATTQKPSIVIEKEREIYLTINANAHRSVYEFADRITVAYERTRDKVANFIGAKSSDEVVFTSGTTESINLVAFTFGEKYVHEGDEVIVSEMEHHANIVPWQELCKRKKAHLKILPVDDDGQLILSELDCLLNKRTKLLAVTHASNVLGVHNPIDEIIKKAHKHNVAVLVDAAQTVAHVSLDVQELGCDFLVFSAHKMYGPTGVGVLYGKLHILEQLPPFKSGGEMVETVTWEKTTFRPPPLRFEPGTANYVGVISFVEALSYLKEKTLSWIGEYEEGLLQYANEKLKEIPDIKIYGDVPNKSPLISFNIGNHLPFDIGQLLGLEGVAVRTGQMCAQPILHRMNAEYAIRVSFSFYNTIDEIDHFIECLKKSIKILS